MTLLPLIVLASATLTSPLGKGFVLSHRDDTQISEVDIVSPDISKLISPGSVPVEASLMSSGVQVFTYNFGDKSTSRFIVDYPSAAGVQREVLVAPTGQIYFLVGNSEQFLKMTANITHLFGVTLIPANDVIAVAASLRGKPYEIFGADDYLVGYNVISKKEAWRIKMDPNVLGKDLKAAWFLNKYVIVQREGLIDCCFAIFDVEKGKEILSKHYFGKDDFNFKLTPHSVLIDSSGSVETMPL